MNSSAACCLAFLGAVPLRGSLDQKSEPWIYQSFNPHGMPRRRGVVQMPLYFSTGWDGCSLDTLPIHQVECSSRESQWASNYRAYNRRVACSSIASSDSVFRDVMPGESITLPNPSEPTGEILLDKEIIEKVAELRTFIEDIEVTRGKKSQLKLLERELSKDNCEIIELTDEEAARMEQNDAKEETTPEDSDMQNIEPYMEINEKTLEPIKEHMYEENMLEEVLGKAFSVYRKNRDQASVQRLEEIATEMAPVVEKVRKQRAEEIIVRLINCYINEEENLDDVLEELQKKKQLNKYLMTRFDELIKLSSQRFRISDKHPAVSERFLRTLKDRVAAQALTYFRGTDKWVRILAECFRYDDCVDYEAVLKKRLTKIEDIEDFHIWIMDGVRYCRENNKMEGRIDAMESIASIVVKLHPVWTPQDTHIETEERPYDQHFEYDIDSPG